MKYAGIAVGALVAFIGNAFLLIVGGSFLASMTGGMPGSEPGIGATIGIEAYMGIAKVIGGVVAGMMAWKTRSAPWVIGAGAAAGVAGAIVSIGIGVLVNIANAAPVASAADLLAPFVWGAFGALGGLLAWAVRPRRSS